MGWKQMCIDTFPAQKLKIECRLNKIIWKFSSFIFREDDWHKYGRNIYLKFNNKFKCYPQQRKKN